MRGRLAPAEEGNRRVTKIRLSVICINGTRWVIIGEGALFAKHEWFPYEDYLLYTIYSAPPADAVGFLACGCSDHFC